MEVIRNLLVTAAIIPLSSCVFLSGPIDIYVRAEGNLQRAAQETCSIRFLSGTGQTRGMQLIHAGEFKAGFLMHGSDTLSDFTAELSCSDEPWHRVGNVSAFARGSPVFLGPVS
jgi:hypothetical protein